MAQRSVVMEDVKSVAIDDDEIEIEVTLRCKDSSFTGKIASPNRQHDQLRAVAHATVQSLNKILQQESGDQIAKIRLEDFRTVVLPNINRIVFLVIIEFIERTERTYISGSSMSVVESFNIEAEAVKNVAKATLDATNRKLAKFITDFK